MVYSLLDSTTDFPKFNLRQLRHPVVIFPSLLPTTLHSVCSPSASVRDGSLLLQLRLGDSNPVWLTPAVMPHPNVDLDRKSVV